MGEQPSGSTHAGDRPAPLRLEIVVTGLVQGVGMRPFLARLARELRLAGQCSNTSSRVLVDVEGDPDAVAAFVRRIRTDAPPLAVVESVVTHAASPTGVSGFTIVESATDAGRRTLVAADTAPCADCLRELADPADRRYQHPFITCTNCGPRFTITLDLPYDRPATTMAAFPMCPACTAEYADPLDRRYHAQPIACHDCGPTLAARSPDGSVLTTATDEAIATAQHALAAGRIVAVKGIGGYHLACDAGSPQAVSRLRERKHRPHQPFAVLVADRHTAAAVAELSEGAARLMQSPARPIVIVPRRHGASRSLVCEQVAPGLDDVGLLLPYSPVHVLLMQGSQARPVLVMTSGNVSGEPLCVDDDDALTRLGSIADLFLTHDRPIAVPCEDSVMTLDADDRPMPVRRSRGYAPLPVRLSEAGVERGPVVLAAGAELKNTVTLVRDGLAFVSAHVGDLGSLQSRAAHERAVAQAERFHEATADLVVADLHPAYQSRAWALARSGALGVPMLGVQHHHAHLAALAAEHGRLDEPLVGLVFDGTGYGCDATIWGGELLRLGDGGTRCERLGQLATFPLPGGDAGVRNPVRMAGAAMAASGMPVTPGTPLAEALTDGEARLLAALPRTSAGWVATSSVGRLFDVVASMLGVRHRVTYEAQAAIELETRAARWVRARRAHPAYHDRRVVDRLGLGMPIVPGPTGVAVLDWRAVLAGVDAAVQAHADVGEVAYGFHVALAEGAAELAARVTSPAGTVGLTGGVFQNRLLTALTRAALADRGRHALTHRLVPPNDGGLSLGQAAVGLAHLRGQSDSLRTAPPRSSPSGQ
ncbi:MAG: carbamoyltransferase HypF [Dermatophilaceae bacterium]